MASFWKRKDKQKGGVPPPPPTSQEADPGTLGQKSGPKPWGDAAVPRQPAAVEDPEEEGGRFCRIWSPGKGWQLSRSVQLLWHMARPKDGNKKCQTSQGAEENPGDTGMQERGAELEGKALGLPEKPGTCPKPTQGGEGQQEKRVASVMAVNGHSVAPRLGEGGRDEPTVGDMPRGGGGRKDEEGRTTGSPRSLGSGGQDRGAVTVPRGNGDREDFSRPSAEERRRQVWGKLHQLGEDMARWEGRSTRELAVRLVEVVLQRETRTYPTETGNGGGWQEQGQGEARAGVDVPEEVVALVDPRVDIPTVWQYPRLQYLAVDHHVPVPIGGTACGDDEDLPPALEPLENEQIWADGEDDLLEEEGFLEMMVLSCHRGRVEGGNDERWREEFPDVWARHDLDCGLVSGEVEVRGAPVPFQKQPRLPAEEEEAVASILQGLLDGGVVAEGSSSSNSPLKPIPKTNGDTWRLTLNCRTINKVTPMVVAPVVLDRIKLITTLSPKSRYFSMVDLSNPSFAIPLAAGSRARFAFTFRDRQYLFNRLPQGFHSTDSIVHKRVAQMLSQLPPEDKPWVISFVDDILIAGRSQKETKARTSAVLNLIQKTGFKAKFEKAQLVQPKVDYLGVTIGAGGREIQASKLEAISRAPSPQSVRDVRSLLGKFVSLKDHIPGYWELARPLHRLTKEHVGWEWGPEEDEALSRLKQAVRAAPPLRFPDKSQPFVISLAPGEGAVGATLLQEDEAGRLVPVGHSSCLLKNREVSYVQEEKGCLAAVWAVRAFETLTGPAPVLIQLPHSPWRYLLWGEALGSRGTTPQPARWTLLLVNGGAMAKGPWPERGQPPGSLVPTAPSFQLLPPHVPKANVWFTASEKTCSVGFAAANLEERWLLGVRGGSAPGAELWALKQLLDHHRCSSPFYWYTGCWSLVEKLQNQHREWERGQRASSGKGLWSSVFQWVHTNPGMLHVRYVGGDRSKDLQEVEWKQKVSQRAKAMSGRAGASQEIWEPSKHEKQEIIAQCHSWSHEGVEGTLARVSQVASWDGASGQVTCWVQNCLSCAAGRDGVVRVLPQRAEGPWSQLQLGYISGLPKTEEGLCSLLVVEDEFSGWVEAFPIGQRTVEEIAEVLFSKVFGRYGTPRALRLPRVPPFLQHAVRMAAFGLDPPWDIPQPGQAGQVTAALQRLAWGAGKEWATTLPLLLAAIRSVWARGAALHPYQIIYRFPLEMREGCGGGVCPQGNVLRWLSQLEEAEAGYKHQTEAALLGDCLEEDAPWP